MSPAAGGSRARHPDLAAYLALMAGDEPFRAHEALETAWRREGDVLGRADAAQALIQVAAAYVHHARGNARAACLLAERAAARLTAPCPPPVDAVLAAAGIDRLALAHRLACLPAELALWPAARQLLTGQPGAGPDPGG